MSLRLLLVGVDLKKIADGSGSPQDKENFGMALLHLLKPRHQQRMVDKTRNDKPERDRYVNGLSTGEVEYLKRMLFGPYRGPEDYVRINRLFKSTLELGCPQPGESHSQVM